MKALVRIAISGAAAVVALGVVFLLLSSKPSGNSSDAIIFASGEPTDVESVTVINSSGVFSFFFDFDEGGYVLDDIPPYIADIEAFFDFMANSARLSAKRQISASGADMQAFGFESPFAEVLISFFDGSQLHLIIGGIERVSGDFYVTVNGFDGVYIFGSAALEQFLLPKTQIISRFVTPPLAVSSPLSAIGDITFTGGVLERPVTILNTAGGSESTALAALSFGAATHIVHGAGVYQLDQTYGVYILGSLFGIEAAGIAGYNLSSAQVAAFGFDTPYMSIDYDMTNGTDADTRHMRLRVAAADNGLYYATLENSGVVFIIGREAFFDIEYEKLLLRWFLTPLIMDLSAITIKAPDTEYRFEINNDNPLDPVITHEGQTLDVTLFRSFFRLLTSASHDDVYLGPLPQPGPDADTLIMITYEYKNPKKTSDVLSLYRGDARRANVFVNGVGEFAMKDLFAERVLEGSINLIAGLPVEENW